MVETKRKEALIENIHPFQPLASMSINRACGYSQESLTS